MDRKPEPNLARFADYAGFQYDLMRKDEGHWIEHAPADFDGRIEAIRISRYGRFGNIFYQTLHAIALARRLGCHTVIASPLTLAPPEAAMQLGGLRIVFRVEPGMDRIIVPTLVGHFFNPGTFESALLALTPADASEIARRYLEPMFRHIPQTRAPVGSQTLVMSFRAGDIFQAESVHAYYVQPPASYYLLALDFARTRLGVTDVLLVFEDDGNPAIARVKAQLDSQDFPYAVQSAGVLADLACLVRATHLVAPFSTFAEAAAMLSPDIETYVGFRSFESHQPLMRRQMPLLLGVLHRKNVRTVLVDDAGGRFTPPYTWDGSPGQIRLIAEYPAQSLRILEGDEAEAGETAQAAADAPRQVQRCQQEAERLRDLLLAGRAEIAAMRRRERDMRQKLVAARARLGSSRQQAAITQDALRQARTRLDELDRAFRTSTSWRVTAPLRWLSQMLRRGLLARP